MVRWIWCVSIPFHTGNFFNLRHMVEMEGDCLSLVSIPFHTGNFFNPKAPEMEFKNEIHRSQSLFIQGTFSIDKRDWV